MSYGREQGSIPVFTYRNKVETDRKKSTNITQRLWTSSYFYGFDFYQGHLVLKYNAINLQCFLIALAIVSVSYEMLFTKLIAEIRKHA